MVSPYRLTKIEPRQPPYITTALKKTNPELKLDQAINIATRHDKPATPPPAWTTPTSNHAPGRTKQFLHDSLMTFS